MLGFSFDYVELYVGMARMVAWWHVKALGFDLVACRGPETGADDRLSFFLRKGDIRLVITSAYHHSPFSFDLLSFVDRHGNGVKRWGMRVAKVETALQDALSKGGILQKAPWQERDLHGQVTFASLKLFDDNEVLFFDDSAYNGPFLPGYEALEPNPWMIQEDSCLESIDHMASALRENEAPVWSDYLNRIFGSQTVQEFQKGEVGTSNSGLTLKVLQHSGSQQSLVLVEPVNITRNSQVQEYLDEFKGTGIQHIAFSSSNIFQSVQVMRRNGVEFSQPPSAYFKQLRKQLPDAGLDFDLLESHGVLCDPDGESYLLQVFTKPIGDRPTHFYEIVQRLNNYQGFGLGNINTLFESVEQEQAARISKKL